MIPQIVVRTHATQVVGAFVGSVRYNRGMVASAKSEPQVFLSYSNVDSAVAREVAEVIRDAGFNVFSADMVFPGENGPLRVGRALESSDAMVVIVSPSSVRSSTVQQEIGYALGSLRYKNKLIPLVVRETRELPAVFSQLAMIDAKKGPQEAGARLVKRLRNSIGARSR